MSTYLCVNVNNSIKRFMAKSTYDPSLPYIRVQDGYFPFTTETTTGTQLKMMLGGQQYRLVQEYTTTREIVVTTGTEYVTRESTQGTEYVTRKSTYSTDYDTATYTYDTIYLTSESTYDTIYETGSVTTRTSPLTAWGDVTRTEVLYTPAGSRNHLSFTWIRNHAYGDYGAEAITWNLGDYCNGITLQRQGVGNDGYIDSTKYTSNTTLTNSTLNGGRWYNLLFETNIRVFTEASKSSLSQNYIRMSMLSTTSLMPYGSVTGPSGDMVANMSQYGWNMSYLSTSSVNNKITITAEMNWAQGQSTNYYSETITTGTSNYTAESTTATNYLTTMVISGTTYLTTSITTNTRYLTRQSTYDTKYITVSSTYDTIYKTITSSETITSE